MKRTESPNIELALIVRMMRMNSLMTTFLAWLSNQFSISNSTCNSTPGPLFVERPWPILFSPSLVIDSGSLVILFNFVFVCKSIAALIMKEIGGIFFFPFLILKILTFFAAQTPFREFGHSFFFFTDFTKHQSIK